MGFALTAGPPQGLARPRADARAAGLTAAGFALFGAGYYLYADLPLGGALRVPAVGALAGGWLLLALYLPRLRLAEIWFAAAMVAVTLASLLLNPAFWEEPRLRSFAGDYTTSYLVFLASLPMALGVLAAGRRVPARAFAAAGMTVLVLMLAGVAAERFAGLDAASDAVRSMLFPPEVTYAEDLRDQLIYGAVRAKLFTSEPSHLSKIFVLALLVWYVTARSALRIPVLFGLLGAGVWLIQSPGVLFALPAAAVADCCRYRRSGWLVLVLLAMAAGAPLAWLAGELLFPERLAHIASGQDGSFGIRFVLPLAVMGEVWPAHPLFGLGFGAKESGVPYALAAARGMGLDVPALLGTNAPLGNNGLLIGAIQLGVAGSLAFAGGMVAYWRRACGPYWPFAAAALAAYGMMIGGINDPRFWGGFALLTAAAGAAFRRDARRAPRQSPPRLQRFPAPAPPSAPAKPARPPQGEG